jgi:hypothetical protein
VISFFGFVINLRLGLSKQLRIAELRMQIVNYSPKVDVSLDELGLQGFI